ncbi:MAG: sigma-70 family RNA polymerase sigma factor [Cyclobacteriaceae bacterium]
MTNYSTLVQKCTEGDVRSQRQFYELLKGKVMGICYRYSKTTEDANDIFQDTMVKVFNNMGEALVVDSVIAWVVRITVNTAIDHTRKRRPKPFIEVDHSDTVEMTDKEASVIEKMETTEILAFLKQLPESQMHVFNLYMIEGYSHREIGMKLGIAESSSRVLLSRAKQHLIQLLSTRQVYERIG